MRQGVGPVACGTVAGLSVVWLGGRFLEPFLFQTAPRDVTLLGAVFAVILAAGIAAAFVPSRRATQISPAAVLKGD
jgi:ABC-type antimicrobial peptide transport system permease subunit